MLADFLSIFGLAIGILTWFGITPQKIGEITKRQLLQNKILLFPVISTILQITAIVLSISSNNQHWWLYAESGYSIIYVWLLYSTFLFKGRKAVPRLLEITITILPTLFLILVFVQLDYYFNPINYANTTVVNKRVILIAGLVEAMIAGITIGMSFFFSNMNKKILSFTEKQRQIEKNCAVCPDNLKHVQQRIQKLEATAKAIPDAVRLINEINSTISIDEKKEENGSKKELSN